MKKKDTQQLVKHPYKWTENFLVNRITPYENRVLVKLLERIKHLQSIGKEPQMTVFGDRLFYFDAGDLVLHKDTDKLDNVLRRLNTQEVRYHSSLDGEEAITYGTVINEYTRKVKDIGENKGKVKIEISKNFYYFLTNLTGGYTQFSNITSFSLSNSYAIKLYYHIKHWFKDQKFKNSMEQHLEYNRLQKERDADYKKYACQSFFSLEDLKREFIIPTSYRSNDIKQRVLNIAKKELDAKSEVSFNYVEKKEGRKIIGFSFVFYRNKPSSPKVEVIPPLDEEIMDYIQILMEQKGIPAKDKPILVGLVRRYGLTRVIDSMALFHSKIEQYKAKKGHSYVKALGILIEGEGKGH